MVAGALSAYSLFVTVVLVAYNLFVLHIVDKLEKMGCDCAMNWKRRFIAVFAQFMIVWLVLVLIAGIIAPSILTHPLVQMAGTLVGLFGLANLAISVSYLWKLRSDNCKCSESVAKTLWEIIVWATVIAYALSLLIILFALTAIGHALSKPKRFGRK